MRIRLQRKPQQLLQLLLERAGETVTREQLRDFLWPNEAYGDFETGLNVVVKKLRDALSDSADQPAYVATEVGVGYRFIAAIERSVRESLPAVNPDPQPFSNRARERLLTETSRRWGLPRRVLSIALVGACLLAIFLIYSGADQKTGYVVTRSTFGPPPGWEFQTTGDAGGSMALSPDGAKVVYVAGNAKTESMLFVRPLNSLVSEPIAGTEGAAMPFWSPDSSHIGFFTVLELRAVDLFSHKVSTICDVQRESPRGASWGANNTIVLAESTRGPIYEVPASGGVPTPVTSLDHSGFTTHRWPRFLPDGRHFLFLAASHDTYSTAKPAIFLGSTDGGPARFLVESDSDAAFVGGEMLFTSGGKLLAQAFDPDTAMLGSSAKVLAENIEVDRGLWHATFDADRQALIYRPRSDAPEVQSLKWFDEAGNQMHVASKPGVFRGVRASPDGSVIAAMCDEPDLNICLVQQDGSVTRVSDRPLNFGPVWSPDGTQIAFGTHRGGGQFGVALKDTAGKLQERTLAETKDGIMPTSWSPNGEELLVERTGQNGDLYLAVLSLGNLKFRDLLRSASDVRDGRFSPDGKWIAFYSNESGRDEVYLSSYPVPSRKIQISRDGGHSPRWGPNGRSLYFLAANDAIFRVELSLSKSDAKAGIPRDLFRPDILRPPYDRQSFDVLTSKRLLLINIDAPRHKSDFVLVTSWRE